ncbi:MAG: GNAT family N-acetyltransferase [Gammaproteobacteria bacterium]|nr:GNAT family N-acetyltransferase [Gammaproteobacteria bacterium]
MNIEVVEADYSNERHKQEIPKLLDQYAADPMGGGRPLADEVKSNLVNELSKLPHAFSIIAYANGRSVGLINCFEVFSTFACRPLINIHDVVVLKEHRGKGISQKMLKMVEQIARKKHCCKITLEVLSKNDVAKSAYRKFGFSGYELSPELGVAMFWQKTI